MQFISENAYVREKISKFFKPINHSYYQDNLYYYLSIFKNIKHEEYYIKNKYNQKLATSLFTFVGQKPTICIVYMHGYGSNKYECLNIINVLKNGYGLCSFDFSGSGRSQGQIVTFGNKQKFDIDAILSYLRKIGYEKFILWGRSMGATSSILYNAIKKQSDIIVQILDSPFYQFEKVALQLAQRNAKLPNFIMKILVNLARQHCSKFQFNPFDINSKMIAECIVPTIFVYSKNDSVVNSQNSQQIIKHCKVKYEKLLIEQNHNSVRKLSTLQQIYQFIQKYKNLQQKKTPRFSRSCSRKKGIEVIPKEQTNNIQTYGIWVSIKFKNKQAQKSQEIKPKRIISARGSARGQLSTKGSSRNLLNQFDEFNIKKVLTNSKYM